MRIAQIADYYPPRIGGVGGVVFHLTQALRAHGVEVEVITTGESSNPRLEQHAPDENGVVRACSTVGSFPLRLASVVKKRHQAKPFDLIHMHQPVGLSFSLFKAIKGKRLPPVVNTIHASSLEAIRQIKPFVLMDGRKIAPRKEEIRTKWLNLPVHYVCDWLSAKSSELNTALSAECCDVAARDYGLKRDELIAVPNGVDTDLFSPKVDGSEIRKKFDLGERPTILYSGAFRIGKRVHHLFHVLKSLRDDHGLDPLLLLVGTGRGHAEELEVLCKELGLQNSVRFAGKLPPNQLPEIYAAADFVAIPSSVEGLPLVLLEAMATGKPTVASRTSAIPDVVKHGETGLLVDVDDAKGLVDAFAELLKSRDKARAIGKAAREEVLTNYTWSKIATQYLNCYRTIIPNLDDKESTV
jgi:glycosyltransferase involved in cell wall biosynthesis